MEIFHEFQTEKDRCPYLQDRDWRLQVRMVGQVSPQEHDRALSAGERRFGMSYFRPCCDSCRSCVPIRVDVQNFRPTKSQRRVERRNQDVEMTLRQPRLDTERLELHYRYHAERASRRGWPAARSDPEEYICTFVENVVPTYEFCYRLGGRLVAVAYVDESPNAFNSIYAFYDPNWSRRSLGTFDVLNEIQVARERSKKFLYLGYYVEGCSSMEYKANFYPHELLLGGRWERQGRPA